MSEKVQKKQAECEMQTELLLAKQPKVKIRIPLHPLNEEDRMVPVCVNGYSYYLKRGETIEVPKTVAEILENASYI